jgi:hypothetical protein
MRIEIFDVGHGHCAVVTSPNGRRLMIDCGKRWRDDRFWTPSLHFFRQRIDLLALMNLDEDHLADFGGVIRDCTVDWILSNPSVGARELSFLKKDGMGPGVRALAGFLAGPNGSTEPFPDFGPLDIRYYWCPYTPVSSTRPMT